MRLKPFHWYDIALGLSPILFPIWQAGLDWAEDRHRQGHQASERQEAIVQIFLALRYWVPVLFALFLGTTYLYKHSKEAAPKQTVHSFLNLLHERFFSHEKGGLNPEFRISLFTPTNWARTYGLPLLQLRYPTRHKHLALYARSGDLYPKSKVSWDGTRSETGRYDGIVGYAWATRIFVDIPNLPEYNPAAQAEREDYLARTFLSAEKAKYLNVLSRSFQALVIQNTNGEKVGVLMMESRFPDGLTSISSDDWQEIAATLQCLFTS